MNKFKKQLTEKMKHADQSNFLRPYIFWMYWDNFFRDEEITNLIEEICDAINKRTV